MSRRIAPIVVAALTTLALLVAGGPAAAEPVPKAQAAASCAAEPPSAALLQTPYGETSAERAAKITVFQWNCMAMVQGRAKQAFDRYVSHDFCDHSHLLTQGHRECGDFEQTEANFVRMAKQFGSGATVEIPTMASVDGEMVTMFGAGVDIFRVHDGMITDHWDASPPAEVTIHAHAPGFTAWVLGARTGPPPMVPASPASGVLMTPERLTAIDVGPLTPYAETEQERANKRWVFTRDYYTMVRGQGEAAARRYLAADFCDHSHMATRARTNCATAEELASSPMRHRAPAKLGDIVEMPYMATVDGDMVTMYGAGVDIFRVRDGKITDHWDASPPREVTIKAHPPQVVQHMIEVLAGKVSAAGPGEGPPPTGRLP